MPPSRNYNLRDDDTKGWIYLYKNDKLIRDRPFNSRKKRRFFLNEFLEACKKGTEDCYYIDIKLDM
jgi:hypothetical protein